MLESQRVSTKPTRKAAAQPTMDGKVPDGGDGVTLEIIHTNDAKVRVDAVWLEVRADFCTAVHCDVLQRANVNAKRSWGERLLSCHNCLPWVARPQTENGRVRRGGARWANTSHDERVGGGDCLAFFLFGERGWVKHHRGYLGNGCCELELELGDEEVCCWSHGPQEVGRDCTWATEGGGGEGERERERERERESVCVCVCACACACVYVCVQVSSRMGCLTCC